jgi:hypothetical protein
METWLVLALHLQNVGREVHRLYHFLLETALLGQDYHPDELDAVDHCAIFRPAVATFERWLDPETNLAGLQYQRRGEPTVLVGRVALRLSAIIAVACVLYDTRTLDLTDHSVVALVELLRVLELSVDEVEQFIITAAIIGRLSTYRVFRIAREHLRAGITPSNCRLPSNLVALLEWCLRN